MALPPLELFSLGEKAALLPGGFFVVFCRFGWSAEGFFRITSCIRRRVRILLRRRLHFAPAPFTIPRRNDTIDFVRPT